MKVVVIKMRKVRYDFTGSCDHCGERLKGSAYRIGEVTACSKTCAFSEFKEELREAADQLGIPVLDSSFPKDGILPN